MKKNILQNKTSAQQFSLETETCKKLSGILQIYFLFTCTAITVNTFSYVRVMSFKSPSACLLITLIYLFQSVIYMLPVIVPVCLSTYFMCRFRLFNKTILCAIAIVSASAMQILIYMDKLIFGMYKLHLDNGFVLNLISTKGGIGSMEAGENTIITFMLIIAFFLLLQTILLLTAFFFKKPLPAIYRLCSSHMTVINSMIVTVALIFNTMAYGISDFTGYSPLISATRSFPLYPRFTLRGIGEMLGFKPSKNTTFKVNTTAGELRYPLHPLRCGSSVKNYNIVMLVAESLRWDMLDPQIMPSTWDFAQHCTWFRQHYSAGHDTRSALFGLFYGLYSPYWSAFREQRHGPVLIDTLLNRKYQMYLYSSTNFSYPEFNTTIFARIPPEQLHPCSPTRKHKWKNDRKQITRLEKALDGRNPDKPFFAYMFFESPHARYFFPPECAIRKPYLKDMNYLTMDLKKDIHLIKNRYINSCYHLDTQIHRVLVYLKEHNLMDSTIIIITGDHGEEFMERGHWGHACGYPQQQIRVPMIIWVPGKSPSVISRMTSHLDIPATLLHLLGVGNPAKDYSFGFDLYGKFSRDFTVVSGWKEIAYIDGHYKAILPAGSYRFAREKVTNMSDNETLDTTTFNKTHLNRLLLILRQLKLFYR